MDDDGDPDILFASSRGGADNNGVIGWKENTDGQGSLGSSQFVSREGAGHPYSLTAADLDGDGDPDVLSGSSSAVSWYDNLGRAVNVTPPEVPPDMPEGYRLSAAFPNPFGPARSGSGLHGHEAETTLELVLARPEQVSVMVYTMLGQRVAHWQEGILSAYQIHKIRLPSGALPAGSYLVQVMGERFTANRQVSLAR